MKTTELIEKTPTYIGRWKGGMEAGGGLGGKEPVG